MLSAVGLEAVDADFLDQVAALLRPPAPRLRVREVRKQGAREPPATVPIRLPVVALHAIPALEHRLAVGAGLAAVRLYEGDLPQQHLDAGRVQPVDHSLRIGPRPAGGEREVRETMRRPVRMQLVLRAVERDERLLVRPCLDDDRADRDVLARALRDLIENARLRVPLVTAHPEPVDPIRRRRRSACRRQERVEHLRRRAGEQLQRDARPCFTGLEVDFDEDAVGRAAADVEADAPAGVDVEAELAADDYRERHREIRAGALSLVLVEDGDVDEPAALVERVEPLAEADDALTVLDTKGEAKAERAATAGEQLDATRHETVVGADDVQRVVGRRPRAGVELEPARARPIGEEPVPQSSGGRDHGSPRRPAALLPEPRHGIGEMAFFDAWSGHAVVPDHLRNGRASRRSVDDAPRAADLELDSHAGRTCVRRRAQLDVFARDGPHGHPLIGLDEVRMPAAGRPMADHRSPGSGNQTSAHVLNAGSVTVS